MSDQPTLGQTETIAELLRLSRRSSEAVPIRRYFVQQDDRVVDNGRQTTNTRGPLASLVRTSQTSALDLLLLVYAVTSGGDYGTTHYATTWSRALGKSFVAKGAAAQVSRLWRQLEDLRLIERANDGRRAKVTKLLEDGSGQPYTNPGGDTGLRNIYFKLPYAYWTDGWHTRLALPAKALLLAGMSRRKHEFAISDRSFARWYGFSPATVARGRKQLVGEGLLIPTRCTLEVNLHSPDMTGLETRQQYTFAAPFDLNLSIDEEKALAARPADETTVTPEDFLFAQPGRISMPTRKATA
ncbi:hypothetical protein [Embleya hyalina]|uniref:Uncharacterized protein n=1 Tax=Embleya hyalina TaxID=516124 RepID=A0A401YYV7_9ACTN|nr:hypothetical protein [Embleya hyalina]GCD99773.1 hypothetical protein EHYA_07495 [Embleya hyalina]